MRRITKKTRLASPLALATTFACWAASAACAGPGQFVWADDYTEPAPAESAPYRIAPGEVLQVRVFNQEQLSSRARVRADGKVSLPLVNDIAAAGLTPAALAEAIQERLKDYIKAPLVTVSLEESRTRNVYVVGEVAKPGLFPIEAANNVLEALVNAGGLTLTANPERIFVLRQAPHLTRIRFTYEALTRLKGKAALFRLQPDDVVVVE